MTRDQRHKNPAWQRSMHAVLGCVCVWVALCGSAFGQVKGSALLLPLSMATGIKTNTQKFLVWDSSEKVHGVYTGTNRASLVRRSTISTNSTPYTNGIVYGITAINSAGVESFMAYFPSNRVGQIVWQTSTNLIVWGDGGVLETFTNVAKTPQMYLRVIDRTKEWQPPN